ncbi:MAG: helix-turn-helix transcriptional regulator [Firmicutes bacterium]|nr:helix-turn-helix transcriptional regulator [Bacillota bacterium]
MLLVKTKQLAETRIRAGLSQRALAKKCGLSGAYLSQLERSQRAPSPQVARRLCDVLQAEFDTLFEIRECPKHVLFQRSLPS